MWVFISARTFLIRFASQVVVTDELKSAIADQAKFLADHAVPVLFGIFYNSLVVMAIFELIQELHSDLASERPREIIVIFSSHQCKRDGEILEVVRSQLDAHFVSLAAVER